MRRRQTRLAVILSVFFAPTAMGAGDSVTITSSRYDGALIIAHGLAPDDIGPGSLAAAVDGDGHVIGILKTISTHQRVHRLHTVATRWPHALRPELEVRWFDVEGRRGVAVWTDEWGARLLVDDRDAARLPAVLKINTGTHELVALLPDGVRAGATVTGPLERPSLLLRGVSMLQDPSSSETPNAPPPDQRSEKRPAGPGTVARWIHLPELGRFYYPGGPVSAPERIEEALPPYPDQLQERGIEGWVTLCAYVDGEGAPRAISRVAESRPVFARLGMEALRQFRFDPATLDDRSVPGAYMITIRWGLE